MSSNLGETIGDEYVHQLVDSDPTETQEWLDSLDAVAEEYGPVRARYLLAKLLERANETRLGIPGAVTTPIGKLVACSAAPSHVHA